MIRFLQTKGRVQQWLLVGFLSIIIIMMVVTLIPGMNLGDYFGLSMNQNVLAKVGGAEITVREVNTEAKNLATQQFRGQAPPQLIPFFMSRALDSLVTRKMLEAEAGRMGLAATTDDVRFELMHGVMAQRLYPEGKFIGQDAYQQLLQSANLTIPQFEEGVRQQLTIRKLLSAVTGGVDVSPAELQQQFKTDNTKVKFEYAVLSLDDVAKSVTPTEAELRAYYEKQKPALKDSIPETRKAKYVLVDFAHAGVKVTDQDLQNYYNQHRDEYRVPESVTVRHILIRTPQPGPDGKVDQKEMDAAKAKAEDVLKQLKAGGSFDALAKKYSDDPGSKDKGGLLGPIQKGQTVPEFEQAAFAAQKGATVGPIKSNFGYHIIHVDDKTQGHVKSLDEVKSQIEPMVAQQRNQAAAENLAKSIESAAKTQGLDKAAAAKGYTVSETPYFPRNGAIPGFGMSASFSDAVFNQKPGAAPQAIAATNGWAVVQATDVKPAETPTFEQAKGQLAEQFRREKAQSVLVQKAQELADKARSEHNLMSAAKQMGATVKTSELVKPGDQVPEIGQLAGPAEVVFSLKPGEIGGPFQAGQGAAVVSVLDRQEPSAAEFEAQKDQIRQTVQQRKRSELVEVYISNLRDKMQKEGKIRINDKQLKALTAASAPE